VTQNAMGEFLVDFGRYGWFPSVLPSETEEADRRGGVSYLRHQAGRNGRLLHTVMVCWHGRLPLVYSNGTERLRNTSGCDNNMCYGE
jgi:hypothetical protein